MEIPEYKLKWLEKQLKLYDEQEDEFFRDFHFICSMLVKQYLQCDLFFEQKPLLIFLKQYVSDVVQSYQGDAHLDIDFSDYDMNKCMICAVWCIDLLQAYDKWKETGEAR